MASTLMGHLDPHGSTDRAITRQCTATWHDLQLLSLRAVLNIVTRYLSDPTDRAAIAEEITALVSTNGSETPLGAHHYG